MSPKRSTNTVALTMIKVFLDTNILVSATFWEGSSYRLLMKIARAEIIGFTTQEILQEYRTILKREFTLNEENTDTQIEKLLKILEIVTPSETIEIIKEDPADNKVLEGAVEARVNFIVSYDKHLLKIRSFRGIRVIKPEDITQTG